MKNNKNNNWSYFFGKVLLTTFLIMTLISLYKNDINYAIYYSIWLSIVKTSM